MSTLALATTTVSYDEPCLYLSELHEQAPGSKGWRRYQVLVVMRGDRPAEFRRDMGPATRFKDKQPFRIPGGAMDEQTKRFHVEHTVGELIDIADYLREDHVAPAPDPMTAPEMMRRYHETKDRQ
jgi:hypothetical protein